MIISKNGLKYVETMKPLKIKPARFIAINYGLIATILSILSYSLIVSKSYSLGYFIGVIASIILVSIMYKKKDVYLMCLYVFFIGANLVGYITS